MHCELLVTHIPIRFLDINIIMSHSLLWRHIVLLTVGVYSSNHRVLYTIGISMTRRFKKTVSPSVFPSVCNANKKTTPPSLFTVE